MFGPRFQWLTIGYRWSLGHQDCQKTALGLFLIGVSTQSEGVVSRFAWQFLSAASYFGVLVVLLIMSFGEYPKHFPQFMAIKDLCSREKSLATCINTRPFIYRKEG